MAKTRNVSIPQVVRDGTDDLSIQFYIADVTATPPSHPRVVLIFPATNGADAVRVDRPLSDFSSLSGAQKTTLRALLTAIRDQALTLEGFA